MSKKIIAILLILLLPAMTISTIPTYNSTAPEKIPLKLNHYSGAKESVENNNLEHIFLAKAIDSSDSSKVYVTDSVLLENIYIGMNSYVLLNNVTLGNISSPISIEIHDNASLIINNSLLISFEIDLYDSATLIIMNSVLGQDPTKMISAYDSSNVELNNVTTSTSSTDGGGFAIYCSGGAFVNVTGYFGDLYLEANTMSGVYLRDVKINNTATFNAFSQSNLSLINLLNDSSLTYISLNIYNSTVYISNSTFINYVGLHQSSIMTATESNFSDIVIGVYGWTHPEKSYAVISNSSIYYLTIESIAISELYNVTVENVWYTKVIVDNNAMILSFGSYGNYYEPFMSDSETVITNIIESSTDFIVLNSNLLVNNTAYINLYMVNSKGLINDSSVLDTLYLYNSNVVIGNGSYAYSIYVWGNSELRMLDLAEGFYLEAYEGSSIFVDNFTSYGSTDVTMWIFNSTLIINNSYFGQLGGFDLSSYDLSLIKINNTIITNTPSGYSSSITIYSSTLKMFNVTIAPSSDMSIECSYSEVRVRNSSIYVPNVSSNRFDVIESQVYLYNSIINVTIYGATPIVFFYGSYSDEITYHGAYIELYNVSDSSLVLNYGYARAESSTFYSVEAWDSVELYNCTILSSVLYSIMVNNGDLSIDHGYLSGSNFNSTLYLSPDSTIDSNARVFIYGLLAYDSIVSINDVTAIVNVNITLSELFVNNSGIGYLIPSETYDVGHAIFINSTITLESVNMSNIEHPFAFNSKLVFNKSSIKASFATYLTNISVYSSYLEEIFMGVLPPSTESLYAGYAPNIPFNDNGTIFVNDSTIQSLIIIAHGNHSINSSFIGYLGCVLSNVTIGNNSQIGTIMETYHWLSDGYVLENYPHGYYLNVTIESDGTVTFTNKTIVVVVEDGYVWVNNSYLFVAVAMDTGIIYINSSKIYMDALSMGSSKLTLDNVTIIDPDGTLTARNNGYVKAYNSTIPSLFQFDLSEAIINDSVVNFIYLDSQNKLTGSNITYNYELIGYNGSLINLRESSISMLYVTNSTFYLDFVNLSDMTVYASYGELNHSIIDYIWVTGSYILIENSFISIEALIDSGELNLFNVTTGCSVNITSSDARIYAKNINASMIGINSENLLFSNLLTGYDGTNNNAAVSVIDSNITDYYGMHFIVDKGGRVVFDNGIITDSSGCVKSLSSYVDGNLGKEVATFYITDFPEVSILGYKPSNNRIISALIVLQLTDNVPPLVTRLHKENMTYELGVTEIILSWSIVDDYPWYYEIYFNETLTKTGSLEVTQFVSINASNYVSEAGLYIVKLIAYDYAGNAGESELTRLTILPSEAPVITASPKSIEFELGMEPDNVTWTITDATPDKYQLYLNDTLLVEDNYTSGEEIVFDTVSEITEAGTHNVTLIAYDGVGNKAKSTVIIKAYPEEAPQITKYPEAEYNITVGSYILLNWTATDRYPDTYQILINNTVVASGKWTSGESVTYNFTESEVGTYIVKIVFNDKAGHSSVHSITINVTEAPAPQPGPGPRPLGLTEIVIIIAISVASILVIFLVIIPHIRRK